MSWRRTLTAAAIAVASLVSLIPDLSAQETQGAAAPAPAQPLTRAQQLEKWGLYEDPGPEPAAGTRVMRFGREYKIERFERKWAIYDPKRPGWVRPLGNVNYWAELYAESDRYVWVFMPVRERRKPEADEVELLDEDGKKSDARFRFNEAPKRVSPEVAKYYEEMRPEFELIVPKAAGAAIAFQESSTGLPQKGSWRNAADVADMNGDGHLDIVTPPQRGGAASLRPHIFLGDGKGNWQPWNGVRWARGINYGSVDAGDLNGDRIQDVVFGVHLQGVAAFLGDGKGQFVDASKGLPRNFPTRRAVLRDLDGDGDLDIIAISEGPSLHGQGESNRGSTIRAWINEGKAASWREMPIAEPLRTVAGDWLTTGDLNGDRRPDIIGSTTFFHSPDIIYLNDGGKKWKPFGRGWLPFRAYYGGVTAGPFTSKKKDDAIIASVKVWSDTLDPAQVARPEAMRIQAIERVTWSDGQPRRVPIARWPSERFVAAIASGDFDGDKNLDIVYRDSGRHENVVLLGDGKGNFARADVAGFPAPKNTAYALQVADVNRDGRDDVVIMYESLSTMGEKDGSVKVFLSRGAQKVQAPAAGK